MLGAVTVIYCICDEVWKVFGLKDDSQCKMSSPEVMAFAIIIKGKMRSTKHNDKAGNA